MGAKGAVRTLTLADLRRETIAKNIHCATAHPRAEGMFCDLLEGHVGEHEHCLRDGSIMAWEPTKREEELKTFDWAAGLNPNKYKSRGALRNHTSDFPCSREERRRLGELSPED